MRDPAASLHFEADRVVRRLRAPLPSGHFLRSSLASRCVEAGKLIPFTWDAEMQLSAGRLEFVSQPCEWTDAQLFHAARLTLDLQVDAVESGFDLKDASAWNVLFDGCRPVFCDLLSFDQLSERRWWALGQYARHFLLPLLVSSRGGLRGHEAFMVWRDGVPSAAARGLLPWTTLLSRYGVLLAGQRNQVHSSVDGGSPDRANSNTDDIRTFRRRVQATLGWQLDGLRSAMPSSGASGWAGYQGDRPHYLGESLSLKRDLVAQWLEHLAPSWVLDLGCNTGEFSRLALDHGAKVVALDADHDSVQRLFLENQGNVRLHPLVAPLDDLRSSRGWAGREYPGLDQRLKASADLVLMLALIHHLAIGAAVPLGEVARFAFRCTRRAVIVELLEADDPQLLALCEQRRRSPQEFTSELQRRAFVEAGFRVIDERRLSGASRSLLLLAK